LERATIHKEPASAKQPELWLGQRWPAASGVLNSDRHNAGATPLFDLVRVRVRVMG
jgi:hypothetical protein